MPKNCFYIGLNVNMPALTAELLGTDANGQSEQSPVAIKRLWPFLNN